MIILHKYTVILPRSKKMHNIPLLSSEFLWLKCIQFLLKPEKYHLWLTVRNYHGQQEIVQRYTTISKFFGNKEFHFLKANISGKSKIFQGESLLFSWFFSTGLLNFGCGSRLPAQKFKPWKVLQHIIFMIILLNIKHVIIVQIICELSDSWSYTSNYFIVFSP